VGALLVVHVATEIPSTRSFEGEPDSRLTSLLFQSLPNFDSDDFNTAWPFTVRTWAPFQCSAAVVGFFYVLRELSIHQLQFRQGLRVGIYFCKDYRQFAVQNILTTFNGIHSSRAPMRKALQGLR
jgi:hypothetical protein